ncbi:unnamed protein product [Orchesella dallaii]|uniref:Partner of Y14 and mago n=1 Tax=Orchesella dallaii TaxID=48710 RepID=A0ABP1QN85_9HEXA
MSSLNVIKDEAGQTFIPSSQRPDGTWRKPIRVRDGYVPQEEQPVYVSKGKQFAQQRSQCPVGMSVSDVQKFKASSNSSSNAGGGMTVGYFEVGNYEQTPTIPGLNFIATSEVDKPKSKSKKSKSKSKSESNDGNSTTGNQAVGNSAATTVHSASTASSNQQTDPTKRLRNLKKRLKEIEALEQRIASGELTSPEKEQLEKIQRKDEVLDDIDELEELVGRLTV